MAPIQDPTMTADSLDYIINHVFLPPQLPQSGDDLSGENNSSLLKLLHFTAFQYSRQFTGSAFADSPWPRTVKMLRHFERFENTDSFSANTFTDAIYGMIDGDVIALHVTAQNAGLVLTRTGDSAIFTFFEASPTSEAVTGTLGKLLISYPGPAIEVPWSTLTDPAFVAHLGGLVDQLKRDVLRAAAETRTKAGETVPEERESANPRFVTELLTGILRGVGSVVTVERFMKRVRDEVLWDDAKVPWRRSPTWLVVRVALRMVLGIKAYKCFMIYFMARVLHGATGRMVDGDRLFVMNAKLARRVHKLRDEVPAIPSFVMEEARMIGVRACAKIEEGWLMAQGGAGRHRWNTRDMKYTRDAILTMTKSRPYIMGLKDATYLKPVTVGFVPNEVARINTTAREMPDLSKAKEAGTRTDIMLADFEAWVMNNLDTWQRVPRSTACSQLGERMEDYMTVAKQAYKGNPLKNSIMILTTMVLWAALDKLAVNHCPLMSRFSPQFNESFLSALLLPQAQQRARLARVENYIQARRSSADPLSDSVFSRDITNQTFSVRYFRDSQALQLLEDQILKAAAAAVIMKTTELQKKQTEYDDLQARIQMRSCDMFTHWNEGWTAHARNCVRCAMSRNAANMRIEVHEWPLPEDNLARAALIFELRCPAPFAIWRETTFRILTDICSAVHTPPNEQVPYDSPATYSGHKPYFDRAGLTRPSKLAYTSFTKSFLATHYRYARLPTTIEDICVKHALKYSLYDTSTRLWTVNRPPQIDTRHLCTFYLPPGPYKSLQNTVRGTSHTANQVLASQSECPAQLQLHEYIAFGLLRSGRRLQWLNILRELRSCTLTFSAEAVSMLVLQAVWQVGPLDTSGDRESHIEPTDTEFGTQMMLVLEAMLRGVEANWQEIVTAQTMIVLAGQILAATESSVVRDVAVRFLKRVRSVALGWTREIAKKLPDCMPSEVREFQVRVVQMAATCRMTFDVEACYCWEVLSSDEDVAVLVECATIIHDNVPAVASSLPAGVKALLERDRRMAFALENHLRDLITGRVGINLGPIWDEYEPGERWTAEEGKNQRWVYMNTEASDGRESQEVHYNLISGELLVAGLALGRMPMDYSDHVTYQELFAEKVLVVFRSNVYGMSFQTTNRIEGYKVAFALHEKELIIRTRRESDGLIHQLIPRSKLTGDFPTNIIRDHVFWLQIPTGTQMASSRDNRPGRIDIRNRATPWTLKKDWYIAHSYDATNTYLMLGHGFLSLDVRSPTTAMISRVLAPLEFEEFIDVRYKLVGQVVTAHLPRLKLDFHIDHHKKLACKQFPGMTIDDDQRIDTFVGLENLLVVRHAHTRSVIVPHGKVIFRRHDSHTKVEIETKQLEAVRYHIYAVNTILGTLVGNGSLTSHLYRIYLHAVTSHCHPDPLTRRTGTEEALAGLRAAATMSFQTVEAGGFEADLFKLISALTPERVYYPTHLKRMQRIRWLPGLSPIAQHDEFCRGVKEVAAYVGLLNIFEDVKGSIVWRTGGDEELAKRAAMRHAIFRTDQFGGSNVDRDQDRVYAARDTVNGSVSEARVAYVVELVASGQRRLNVHPGLLGVLEKFGDILVELPTGLPVFGYSREWLEPDLADVWVSLYNSMRCSSQNTEMYDWMFLLSTLAYLGKIDLRLIETLLAFATDEMFAVIYPPNHPSFNLNHGYEPSTEILTNIIGTFSVAFGNSGESILDAWPLETELETNQRRFKEFTENKEEQSKDMVHELLRNWPCPEPEIDDEDEYPLYNVPEVLEALTPWFASWTRNAEFRDHISEVQEVLDRIDTGRRPVFQVYRFKPCQYTRSTQQHTIRLLDLLTRSPPTLPPLPRSLRGNPMLLPTAVPPLQTKDDSLGSLLRDFRGQQRIKPFRKIYTELLEKSIVAFQSEIAPSYDVDQIGLVERLKSLEAECKRYMEAVLRAISIQLSPVGFEGYVMAYKAGLWPRLSPLLLLRQLATNSSVPLSPEWRASLVTYGIAITMVQRVQRLLHLGPQSIDGTRSDFLKELENTGHTNWNPLEQPDWLLIEIENNFLIRPVQADIAKSMVAPPDNRNSIMQLCMGEGKTSVIVPIVAALLADGTKLVRVIVLKPLAGQMFQMLVQKLGGLVNRRIYFMPFSRGVAMGKKEIADVRRLYQDCMKNGGILLVQPEHILSFKLLGLEWLYNSKHIRERKAEGTKANSKNDAEVAKLLLGAQRWLDENSRDILDESDEILNVKHELIYTIGNPAPIDNHPDRWVIIQEIFDLIQKYFKTATDTVQDFELERHEQVTRFGSIRILNQVAGRKMLLGIAAKIVEDQLLTISFRLFPAGMRKLAVQFITVTSMTLEQAEPLLRYIGSNNISSGILYLLRGLIAHNILLFSLNEKRWKVDYGLDLKRSLLAVPYRAKDSPAGKAEFSHPDVAITLTCLSYYYGGLDEKQLETSFRNLYKSDNPALQYERWIKGVPLPKSYLNRLTGINLDDKKQWNEIIYPTFHYNKAVIDSYLAGVVFPAEAKEFPHKLSTSGWDVAASKVHPTTGFSGTNDNRYLLPLSMHQLDTNEQMNTNARVLSYLLQKENHYMCTASPDDKRIGVVELLKILAGNPGKQETKVLLDVGAQVLELRNHEVAKRWLEEVSESTARAAVYFNDNDELTVLTRDGNTEPLMVSAFAERLDGCLVYLDEAHTRGTDLKLPRKSRAAVTLGPNLTKDRLVQACMRMRKLGNGHSVLFCGPPEIHRKILAVAQTDGRDDIKVRDVLFWCMDETCQNARKLFPIWAKQGISYQKHLKAGKEIGDGRSFPNDLLEKESKTLQAHYGFEKSKADTTEYYRQPGDRESELAKILNECEYFGVKSFTGARMLEEQERELAHEVECERVNQRPRSVGPLKPHLSEDVKQFILTGTLRPSYHQPSTRIIPAFSILAGTSALQYGQRTEFSGGLLATSDFCEVVEGGPLTDGRLDDFLRPVHWIVSSTVNREILVIMSSFEVNRLLPDIRQSSNVTLHMYSPQVTRSTPSYELLNFCPIPPLPFSWKADIFLVDQLNIFAGQLYFPNHEAYRRVCGFLGLHLEDTSLAKRVHVGSDGFVDTLDRHVLNMRYLSPFTKSPVTLLRTLLGFRRKGQSYISTHMGHLLHGRSLTVEDIENKDDEERSVVMRVSG